jgi:hypothetical protein
VCKYFGSDVRWFHSNNLASTVTFDNIVIIIISIIINQNSTWQGVIYYLKML